MRTAIVVVVFLIGINMIVPGNMAELSRVNAHTGCMFTPTAEGAKLYYAPLTDPGQEHSALVVGQGYLVQRQHAEHFYVTLDGLTGGWVDRRSGMLSGNCDQLPVDSTPLSAFPTICVLTSASAIPLYGDAALTDARDELPAGTQVVIQTADDAAYVRLGHAFGGWVPLNAGSLGGACDTVPPATGWMAWALANARAWTRPDVKTGAIVATLTEGAQVVIVAGPVRGPIRFDTADEGDWYQVAQSGQVVGWIWAERLDFDTPPPPPVVQTALTQPNARLWTQPDVKNGGLRAYLPTGLLVTVLAGPITGPIRYDTADLGEWYYVQPGGGYLPGWIWAERLTWE